MNLQTLNENDRDLVVEYLCEFLFTPTSCKDVAECFPQMLLLLLSLVIDKEEPTLADPTVASSIHKLNCHILGQLININPDVLG